MACIFERLTALPLKSFEYQSWKCHVCAICGLLSAAVFPCPLQTQPMSVQPVSLPFWLPLSACIAAAGLCLVPLISKLITFFLCQQGRVNKVLERQMPHFLFTNKPQSCLAQGWKSSSFCQHADSNGWCWNWSPYLGHEESSPQIKLQRTIATSCHAVVWSLPSSLVLRSPGNFTQLLY